MSYCKVLLHSLIPIGAASAAAVFFSAAVFVPAKNASGGWLYVKEQPNLVVSPTPIPYERKVKVMIAGSGFEPNQDIEFHIVMGGVLSDVTSLMKPVPKPNEYGAFSAEWTLNREIRAKLLEPTAYTLEAVDENGRVLAHAPLVLVKHKEEKKKKK